MKLFFKIIFFIIVYLFMCMNNIDIYQKASLVLIMLLTFYDLYHIVSKKLNGYLIYDIYGHYKTSENSQYVPLLTKKINNKDKKIIEDEVYKLVEINKSSKIELSNIVYPIKEYKTVKKNKSMETKTITENEKNVLFNEVKNVISNDKNSDEHEKSIILNSINSISSDTNCINIKINKYNLPLSIYFPYDLIKDYFLEKYKKITYFNLKFI